MVGRLGRGGELPQAPPRVGGVRAPRVAVEIGPVGVRRVRHPRPAPGQRLAPRREDRPHALGERVLRVGGQERLVGLQAVLLQAAREGVPRPDLPEGPPVRARQRGKRRRLGAALEEHEGRPDPGAVPGHGGAAGRLAHPQADAREQFGRGEAALPHHLGEGLRVGAVGARLLRRDRAGRRVERDERVRLRLDQGEAARERLAGDAERHPAARVEHQEAGAQRQGGEALGVIRDAQRPQRHVRGRADAGIDRHEVVLALDLQPVAREVHEGHRLRPGRRGPVGEVAQRPAQPVLVEVAGADHVESRRLQGLGDEAGIVRRGGERARRVGAIADHQRDSGLGRRGAEAGERQNQGRQANHESDEPARGLRHRVPLRLEPVSPGTTGGGA